MHYSTVIQAIHEAGKDFELTDQSSKVLETPSA